MANDELAVLYMVDELTHKWSREVLREWEIKNIQLHASKGLDAVERMFNREVEEDLARRPDSPLLHSMKRDGEQGLVIYKLMT